MTLVRLFILTLAFAILTGCQTYTKVEKTTIVSDEKNFVIEGPKGWIRANNFNDAINVKGTDGKLKNVSADQVVLTRDGLALQYIKVTYLKHDNAFPAIDKKSNNNLLTVELADLAIAEMKAGEGIENLKVLEISSSKISHHEAYKLVVQYKNEKGLRFNRLVYGFVNKHGYYTLTFQAPFLYYYSRDLSNFERVVHTFKLSTNLKSASLISRGQNT